MSDSLKSKLAAGRPVAFTEQEATALREALREAVAVTLGVEREAVANDARIFDDLGLDSIDVFDVLDQLAERYDVQVALEELPESLIHGVENATFDDFVEGIVDYFASAPAPPKPAAADPRSPSA